MALSYASGICLGLKSVGRPELTLLTDPRFRALARPTDIHIQRTVPLKVGVL